MGCNKQGDKYIKIYVSLCKEEGSAEIGGEIVVGGEITVFLRRYLH